MAWRATENIDISVAINGVQAGAIALYCEDAFAAFEFLTELSMPEAGYRRAFDLWRLEWYS